MEERNTTKRSAFMSALSIELNRSSNNQTFLRKFFPKQVPVLGLKYALRKTWN